MSTGSLKCDKKGIMHQYKIGEQIVITGTNPEVVPELEILHLLPDLKYQCCIPGKLPITITITLNEHQISQSAPK